MSSANATQNTRFTDSRNPGTREVRSSKSEVRSQKSGPRRSRAAVRVDGGRPDLSRYPLVMTKRQVAEEVFGKSVRWLEQLLASGEFPIPHLKHLKPIAFSKARVAQFFEQDTFEPPTSGGVEARP